MRATIPNAVTVIPYANGVLAFERSAGVIVATNTQLEFQRRALGWLDWTIVVAYFAAMLSIGFYFWRRSRMGSTSEFFLGSRTIPFWAAGISMFASNTSSISYLAVPAKAFDTDWQYMMSKVVTVFALMAVAFWVIPLFRRLNLVSVFTYLETRFHPAIRMLSSALAILMHVGGRMGVVLFLPALAIGTITGTNVIFCIMVIGICTIVYTALGGMKAVIWTDVFQVIVLFGGAFFAIGFIIHAVGFSQIYETAMQFDKTKMVNVSFDFTTPTIWGFIILYTFDTVLTFPKDQVLMQRVLSTPSEKEASRSVWFFAAVLLPAGFIFYIIGTTLFAYYRANPGRLDPLLPIDAVFPAFIGTELPHGVTGIIIAGLFAAAMGTLSGTINSVATLLSVDFYERLKRVRADPETGGALRRVDDGAGRAGRHRARGDPVAARRPFAARSHDRAVRPDGRQLRGRLHARHVHHARELAGYRDRHHRCVDIHVGLLGVRAGAPLFLSRDRDRLLDRASAISLASCFRRRGPTTRRADGVHRRRPTGRAADSSRSASHRHPFPAHVRGGRRSGIDGSRRAAAQYQPVRDRPATPRAGARDRRAVDRPGRPHRADDRARRAHPRPARDNWCAMPPT